MDKKVAVTFTLTGTEVKFENQQLAEELCKPIIRKFKWSKVYSFSKDNILGAHPADMQSIRKSNKRIRYFLCVIDIVSKHAWDAHFEDKKKVLQLVMHFKSFCISLNENDTNYG